MHAVDLSLGTTTSGFWAFGTNLVVQVQTVSTAELGQSQVCGLNPTEIEMTQSVKLNVKLTS